MRDYTKAFDQLIALGLPPLDASAKWVKSGSVYDDYQLRSSLKGYRGNAWIAGEGKEALLIPFGEVDSRPNRAAFSASDVEKDAGLILAALLKLAPTGDDDADEDSDDDNILSRGGQGPKILVFATQLYQTGRKDLANRICAALFAAEPDPESLIDSVVGMIAGVEYDRALQNLLATADWAAFRQSLIKLTGKFPRGWNGLEGAKNLAERVKPQAEGVAPPPLVLPGMDLSATSLAFVARLGEGKKADGAPDAPGGAESTVPARPTLDDEIMQQGFRSSEVDRNWLFMPATSIDADDPLQGLLATGMEAVPVLAAMLGDPFLTLRLSSSSSREFGFGATEGIPDQPLSRGNLAREVLLAGLPGVSPEEDDDDLLRENAMAFWKEFHAAGPEKRVIHFLRNGDPQHRSVAMRLLAASSNPEAHTAFEEHVLSLDSVFEVYEPVRIYLRNRKKDGLSFYERFAEIARAQAPADSDDEDGLMRIDYRLRELGGVENMLKILHAAVDTEGPRALVTAIAKGDPAKAEAAIRALSASMGDTPFSERHIYWLRGANLATNATVRVIFLRQIINSPPPDAADDPSEGPASSEAEEPGGEEEPPDATLGNHPPVRKIPEGEAKVWRKLISDKRVVAGEAEETGPPLENETVGDIACIALLHSLRSGERYLLQEAADILERPILEMAREAAAARLAGREPDWPDASQVTPERLQAIIAQAGGMKTADIPAFIKGLSPDERAAWKEWFSSALETGEAPESVLGLTRWVRRHVDWSDGMVPAMGDGSKLLNRVPPGFELTPEWVQNHLRGLATAEKPTPPCWLIFQSLPGDGMLGLCEYVLADPVSTEVQPKPEDDPEGDEEENPTEDDDPDDRRYWARSVLSNDLRALAASPASFASATLTVSDIETEEESVSLTLLIAREGSLSVAKAPDPAAPPAAADPLAAIRTLLSEEGRLLLHISFMTRTHADTIFKDIPLSDDDEDPSE